MTLTQMVRARHPLLQIPSPHPDRTHPWSVIRKNVDVILDLRREERSSTFPAHSPSGVGTVKVKAKACTVRTMKKMRAIDRLSLA